MAMAVVSTPVTLKDYAKMLVEVTGFKVIPTIGSVAVISTLAVGCPVFGEGTFEQKMSNALNTLRHDYGWRLVHMAGNATLIFEFVGGCNIDTYLTMGDE